MPEPDQNEAALPQGYQVGTTIVMPMPAERAFPLTQPDFLTLCDGSNGSERAARDLHIGLFVSAVIGIAGLLSCVDWSSVLAEKRWLAPSCFLALVAITALSAWSCVYHWRQLRKDDTPYTRLKQSIAQFFRVQTPTT